jgi:hypothetical protein
MLRELRLNVVAPATADRAIRAANAGESVANAGRRVAIVRY